MIITIVMMCARVIYITVDRKLHLVFRNRWWTERNRWGGGGGGDRHRQTGRQTEKIETERHREKGNEREDQRESPGGKEGDRQTDRQRQAETEIYCSYIKYLMASEGCIRSNACDKSKSDLLGMCQVALRL